ncbi:hypothetical protein COLO4_05539 [Corchorus olitorius]|uniref:3'-5' exonuclease domain-containing protein n=1 Tax=Corchorus olitorius TaxID=93759 RepID=A0A1R3KQP6_9ROSI|nr:hypothetical protein COLO4_05539 [Corchorus olitorius]
MKKNDRWIEAPINPNKVKKETKGKGGGEGQVAREISLSDLLFSAVKLRHVFQHGMPHVTFWVSKLDTYEVEIQGLKVKATVVDLRHPTLVTSYIKELKSSISKRCIVGLDIQTATKDLPFRLILCAGARFIIIQWNGFKELPSSLIEFLKDETVCFVGSNIAHKISIFAKFFSSYFNRSLELELSSLELELK